MIWHRHKKLITIMSIIIFLVILLFITGGFFLSRPKDNMDSFDLDVDNINSRIETITSAPYYGRQTGSKENSVLLKYIENEFRNLGLVPAGVNDTYYQPFLTMIADVDTKPIFSIPLNNQGGAKELTLFEDFNIYSSINGGGIDFKGELLFVKDKLFSVNAEEIKGRVVIIEAEELSLNQIDYVIQNEGRGLFCCADYKNEGRLKEYEKQKNLSVSGKTGKSIAIGYISKKVYEDMQKHLNQSIDGQAGLIKNVIIKVKIDFPVIETANILGKIEGGKNNTEVLIITADIDGAGFGTQGEYFEGALKNASGISVLLEVARVIVERDLPLEKTIVFMGLDGQEQDFSGSDYYANNPLFYLSDSTFIHLEAVGTASKNGLLVATDDNKSIDFRNIIIENSRAQDLLVTESFVGQSATSAFSQRGATAVSLSDVIASKNIYNDKAESIDSDYLRNSSMVLLGYVEATAYSGATEVSNVWDRIGFALIKLISAIKGFFVSGTDTADSISEYRTVISESVFNSLKLIISALVISMFIGIVSGLYSGYRSKKRSMRSIGALIGLSIPDVLVILLGWTITIYYGMYLPNMMDIIPIRAFIMPLITVAILPTVYISRITFVNVQEELKKDYLRNSKASGASRKRIIFNDLLPAALFKIIDTLPTIMTMLMGNLILVEYLYNYLGAAYYLVYFYNKKAYFGFIILVLALATIFVLFTFLTRWIAKSVNPVKREVSK